MPMPNLRTALQALGLVTMPTPRPCPRAGGLNADTAAEVDVESEEQQVLSMASVLGTSRQDVEKALLDADGDWEFVMQVRH